MTKRLLLPLALLIVPLVGLFSTKGYAMNVVVSIKPLQLITLEITKGLSQPSLLISANASPHDYALKPSDIKKLKRADLVIWFGPSLERYLQKVVSNSTNTLQFSTSEGIDLRPLSAPHSHSGHGHSEEAHAGDDSEYGWDSHFWLGPVQARQAARLIADRLTLIDPDNSKRYLQNYQGFVQQLDQRVAEMAAKLSSVQDKGYYVFHDAYGYFEEYFHLNKLGYFTLSPERKPGAKTLIQIRTALRGGDANCVFSEPQFTPAVIASVTRGSQVRQGELDPLATSIEAKPGAYLNFLDDLTSRYIDCLSQ